MELIQRLKEIGFNRDVVIDEDSWNYEREKLHETRYSLAAILGRDEETFRDQRPVKSLELKDCSNLEDIDGDYVAELEKFNPEKHPILHVLADFPVWIWRNRIKNCEPAEMEPDDRE